MSWTMILIAILIIAVVTVGLILIDRGTRRRPGP